MWLALKERKNPLDFGCGQSKVKVTVTKIECSCPHHMRRNDHTMLKLGMCVAQERDIARSLLKLGSSLYTQCSHLVPNLLHSNFYRGWGLVVDLRPPLIYG